MQNLKFFTLLRTLNEEEISSFHKYLKRLHLNEEKTLATFAYLRNFYPEFRDEKKLQPSYVYRKIFKTDLTESNRKNLLNMLSDLYLWLKDFLLLEKVKSISVESQAIWLAILQERGLEAEFSKQFYRLQNEVQSSSKMGITDHMKHMAIHYFIYYYIEKPEMELKISALQSHEDSLDLFYAITKLKIACEKATVKNVLSIPLKIDLSYDFGNYGTRNFNNHPLFLLYREIYRLIVQEEEDSFRKVETMLTEYAQKVSPTEMYEILSYLSNYASAQIRKGKEEYWERSHKLNKFGVELGVFLQEKNMPITTFNNIVRIASKVGDIDWADSFVRSQGQLLQENLRHDAIILAEAAISFEKKEYDIVLKNLERRDFKDLLESIRSRILVLASHYELGHEDNLLDFCSVFEAYLSRHNRRKIEAVGAALNFSYILKMLVRRSVAKHEVIHEIESRQPLFLKPWLLENATRYRPLR